MPLSTLSPYRNSMGDYAPCTGASYNGIVGLVECARGVLQQDYCVKAMHLALLECPRNLTDEQAAKWIYSRYERRRALAYGKEQ
jgi:hypothetical protein